MKIKHTLLLALTLSTLAVQATVTMPVFLPRNPNANINKNIQEPEILEELKLEKTKNKEKQVCSSSEAITSGKGIWVNVWNYPTNTDSFMAKLKRYKIDTIYLQINRSTTPVYKNKAGLDAVLKAAHENNIKVIGWSYCYLNNVQADADKFIQPAKYVSPNGDRLDGMAADIEENVNLWAVKTYTEKIKKSLPKDYPLIAIVFSPRIKQNYPWEYIGHNWDVVMPMVYWHGLKNRTHETVENFVKDSILNLRKLCKKDDLNIHLITDGERTSAKEVQISLNVAREHGVNAGISVYPEHLASDEILDTLRDF